MSLLLQIPSEKVKTIAQNVFDKQFEMDPKLQDEYKKPDQRRSGHCSLPFVTCGVQRCHKHIECVFCTAFSFDFHLWNAHAGESRCLFDAADFLLFAFACPGCFFIFLLPRCFDYHGYASKRHPLHFYLDYSHNMRGFLFLYCGATYGFGFHDEDLRDNDYCNET